MNGGSSPAHSCNERDPNEVNQRTDNIRSLPLYHILQLVRIRPVDDPTFIILVQRILHFDFELVNGRLPPVGCPEQRVDSNIRDLKDL